MQRSLAFAIAGFVTVTACTRSTRTVLLPDPEVQSSAVESNRGPSTAATLGLPPGQLPQIGECRIWIPGTPPGRQPRPRSRSCGGISAFAPAGSWIVYRPAENRRLVYVREVSSNQSGAVIRTRVYDVDTNRFLREEIP
jgi:hypothetical protein